MGKKPEILKQTTVARSQRYRVESLELRFENGEERVYERLRGVRKRTAVVVVPIYENQLVLIREYCAGVHDYVLTFPKGLVDQGEDVLTAANRELQEEAGYAARQLRQLDIVSTSPGDMAGRMPIVLAQGLYPSKLEGDEPEDIEVVHWDLSQLSALVQQPDFHEARCMAALFLMQEALNGSI